MIYGLGCDLVDCERIQKLWTKAGDRFIERVLTPSEQHEFQSRSKVNSDRGLRFLASRFAAKEAFSKAMGTGIGAEFSFLDLSILNDAKGAPVLVFSEKLKAFMAQQGLRASVSLSDEKSMAMAVVIIETLQN